MPKSLSELTEFLLDAARKAGADGADALVVDGTSISIDALAGKLEHAERAEGIDVGLRVIVNEKQACVSTSDSNPDTLRTMAERAVAMANEAPQDPYIVQATPDQYSLSIDLTALEMADPSDEPDPSELENHALRAEAAALKVSGVSQVQATSAGYTRNHIHLATSVGFSGGYTKTSRALSCVAITGSGTDMERDYCGEQRIFQADLPDPESIGQLAGERTVQRAGARKPKTGSYPVLFDERISSSLIGHLLAATNGASIVRGSSWARDLIDQQVLPKGLNLYELPHRARISGSRPFDAEGIPTGDRPIIDDGILTGWTLDLSTGQQLGMPTTGNAARGTSAPPSPSVGNVSLTGGTASHDDLLRDMGTGLLVTSMIGSSINATTGDYSRGASGFWVENGQISHPVNECTIAGNLRDMLSNLVAANDGRQYLSRVVPSLLVTGLTLAGE